ncbi:unnamed protein product [Prunus armeniaca]
MRIEEENRSRVISERERGDISASLYLEEGTPSSCSQNERQTKEPSSRMHGSWTFLFPFPFPFRKELVRGKDSDTSVTYRLVHKYCGLEVDVDKLENAFTGISPGKD